MIVAYQGKADYPAAELSSPSTPLHLRCKPLRGFGGMTARLGRARDAAMPFKATPIHFDHRG
jgi:hypothetical protein